MAYSFEQIFAIDPASPENVAKNGTVTIFAPGDVARTPLAITSVDGLTLPNPIQVNEYGFGPAFMHETLDRVAWAGSGFEGFFTSYDGIKQEAIAARTAAEGALKGAAAASEAAAKAAGLSVAPTEEVVVETLTKNGPVRDLIDGAIDEATSLKLDKSEAEAVFARLPENGALPVGQGELAFNAKSYGTQGDGIVDDAAAMQRAVNVASAAGVGLYIPAGRYRINTSIVLPSNVSVRGEGFSTVLVQGDPSKAIFTTPSNGESLIGSLFGDVSMGATQAALSGYRGNLAPKDVVILADRHHYDNTISETAYATYSGELLEVDSVASSTVVFKNKVRGSFHPSRAYSISNGAYLNKVNMVRGVDISSVTFEGLDTSSIALVRLFYCQDVRLDKLNCTTSGRSFIELQTCKDVSVTNTNVQNLVDNLATGQTGYGVRIQNACDGVIVDNLIANNMRHAVTTTGGGKGIPRRLIFNAITAVNMATAAGIDTHSAGDDILISNCVVENCALGITVRSKNTVVVNNVIRQCITGLRIAEDIVESAVLSGNLVQDCRLGLNNTGISKGLYIRDNVFRDIELQAITVENVTDLYIEDNNISRVGNHGIRVGASNTDVLVKGNTVTQWGAGSLAIASFAGSGGGGRADILDNTLISRGPVPPGAISLSNIIALVAGNRIIGPYSGTKVSAAPGSVITGNPEHA